jgi:hypothetical protein
MPGTRPGMTPKYVDMPMALGGVWLWEDFINVTPKGEQPKS